MNLSEQLKNIWQKHLNSQHFFVSEIQDVVTSGLDEMGVPTKATKTWSNTSIDIKINGVAVVSDKEKADELEDKIREFMQDISNPATLIDKL